ncbi:MAG: GIY-YIG nuclease family protein [Cyanobacteria bacterium J06642_2]
MAVSICNINLLPKASGIYKVRDPLGEVVYVGQSINIYQRWKNGHEKFPIIIERYGLESTIEWTLIPRWLLNRAENAAVAFHEPELNARTPSVV